jgi:hypothetical protein
VFLLKAEIVAYSISLGDGRSAQKTFFFKDLSGCAASLRSGFLQKVVFF